MLEDLDYYCVDNLPTALIPALVDAVHTGQPGRYPRIAVGVDVRNRAEDLLRLPQILAQIAGAMQQAEAPGDDADSDDPLLADVERAQAEQQRLDRMASGYTTEEQRRIHQGLEAETVAPREVDFF